MKVYICITRAFIIFIEKKNRSKIDKFFLPRLATLVNLKGQTDYLDNDVEKSLSSSSPINNPIIFRKPK